MSKQRDQSRSAINLFVKKGVNENDCYRCGKRLRAVKPSAKSAERFKEMTGQTFPWPSISLNVEADAKTLGLTAHGRGAFCGDCAVAYMTEFNRLLLRAN